MEPDKTVIPTPEELEELGKGVRALMNAKGNWVLVNRDEAPKAPHEEEQTTGDFMTTLTAAIEVIDVVTKSTADAVLNAFKAALGVIEG